LLRGAEDNNNNSIEENSLSDDEDSVSDVLCGEESDSDSESGEEDETFIPGVEDNQSIGSKDPAPHGDPIPEPLRRSGRAPVQRTTLKPTFQGRTYEANHSSAPKKHIGV